LGDKEDTMNKTSPPGVTRYTLCLLLLTLPAMGASAPTGWPLITNPSASAYFDFNDFSLAPGARRGSIDLQSLREAILAGGGTFTANDIIANLLTLGGIANVEAKIAAMDVAIAGKQPYHIELSAWSAIPPSQKQDASPALAALSNNPQTLSGHQREPDRAGIQPCDVPSHQHDTDTAGWHRRWRLRRHHLP
jgi:hypothetical protein